MSTDSQTDSALPALRKLGATLTPEARAYIDARLGAIVSFEPAPGLLYGNQHTMPNAQGSWSLIAYSEENVRELADFYGQFGAEVCFELDGLKVVVPQIGRLDQLDSGSLQLRDQRLWQRTD